MTHPSPARTRHANTMIVAIAATLVFALAGCGSKKSSSSSGTTATTAATGTTAASGGATTTAASGGATTTAASGGGAGTAVAVKESEFKIELATSTFKPGTYTFNSTNGGSFKHNLTIDGPGVSDQKTDNIDPGKSGSVTAKLAAGTYEIYCSIPTHKDKGMDLTITVA
jgi:uncharacterized cupredoxin-like copper-binding protein